MNWGRSANK